MASLAYAKVQRKQSYLLKNVFVKGAMAAYVATIGLPVVTHYFPNNAKAETKQEDMKSQPAKSSLINLTPLSYTKPKQYVKSVLINAYSGDGHMSQEDRIKSNTAETTSFPVVYGGKLPVGYENIYTINNSREYVDISHKVEMVSIPVSYGGRLPVGRER